MAHERIAIDPEIMGGKPVIRGTRVPVELILRKLGAGMMAEAIIADHPHIKAIVGFGVLNILPGDNEAVRNRMESLAFGA